MQLVEQHVIDRDDPRYKVAPKAFESRVVEDGKARFSHALVVHPVRFVRVPLTKPKREI